jgi:hypothetical protein
VHVFSPALQFLDSRDKYVDKVAKLNSAIEARLDNLRKRIAVQFSEEEALALESKYGLIFDFHRRHVPVRLMDSIQVGRFFLMHRHFVRSPVCNDLVKLFFRMDARICLASDKFCVPANKTETSVYCYIQKSHP